MAWSNLANNQMVSYTDAQTGGFTLNSGQSSVTSNECMTKSAAFTKYNLAATANTNALASNQLMRKDFWVAGTPPVSCYAYPEIGFGSTANVACNNANIGDFVALAGDAAQFQNATTISRRCPLGQLSAAGWYSNGSIARQWNGVGFIQQSPCQQ
jgi:hypothetical protein